MMFRTPDLLTSSGKDDGQRPNKDYVSVVGTWYLLAGLRTSAVWVRLFSALPSPKVFTKRV